MLTAISVSTSGADRWWVCYEKQKHLINSRQIVGQNEKLMCNINRVEDFALQGNRSRKCCRI